MLKRSISAGLLIFTITFDLSAQQTATPPPQPVTLPNVIATADRVGGGTIICRGEGCATMLLFMQFQANLENLLEGGMIDDAPIRGNQFCANLRNQRPASNCHANTAPSTPGITAPGQTPWQANGCGDSRRTQMMGNLLFNIVSSETYSGDLNAPYPGVSFTGACDAHDACWGTGGSRAACDASFYSSMSAACNGLNDASAVNACTGYAGLYHGGVSTTNQSNATYASSVQTRQCSIWAQDMRENNCGN